MEEVVAALFKVGIVAYGPASLLYAVGSFTDNWLEFQYEGLAKTYSAGLFKECFRKSTKHEDAETNHGTEEGNFFIDCERYENNGVPVGFGHIGLNYYLNGYPKKRYPEATTGWSYRTVLTSLHMAVICAGLIMLPRVYGQVSKLLGIKPLRVLDPGSLEDAESNDSDPEAVDRPSDRVGDRPGDRAVLSVVDENVEDPVDREERALREAEESPRSFPTARSLHPIYLNDIDPNAITDGMNELRAYVQELEDDESEYHTAGSSSSDSNANRVNAAPHSDETDPPPAYHLVQDSNLSPQLRHDNATSSPQEHNDSSTPPSYEDVIRGLYTTYSVIPATAPGPSTTTASMPSDTSASSETIS
ncbi:uncharacterized protein LOC101860084 isoform X2 [Aplysia californica]|uniref:Uncharacterized protein LOC101860084 isoform X2 n=1 Tax=Aplysia californica TaxID=6500 RepID=A0ABM0ZWE8_APLCA|nr:uncharacterized protein LOC101860084 isoform X2 [Aplysia californica]